MNTPLTRSTHQVLAAACLGTVLAVAAQMSIDSPRAHAQTDAAAEAQPGVDERWPFPLPTISPCHRNPACDPNPIKAHAADSGSIVFLSDRPGSGPAGKSQVWLKADAGDSHEPTELTSEPEGARSPVWFPRTAFGDYAAYITAGEAGHDVIKIVRTDGLGTPWVYGSAPQDLGTERIDYLTWSPNGMKLCFAHYNLWHTRGLACLTFPTHAVNPHPNFVVFGLQQVIPVNLNPAPSESAFSADSQTIYFSGDKGTNRGYLYRVAADASPATVWSTLRLLRDDQNRPVRKAFAPSVGGEPGAEVLIFNSEEAAADPQRGEELRMLDLVTGQLSELTQVPGHQYGSFLRRQGPSLDFAMQSNADLSSANPQAEPNYDLFLGDIYGSGYTKVDIADPDNNYSDHAPDWIQ